MKRLIVSCIVLTLSSVLTTTAGQAANGSIVDDGWQTNLPQGVLGRQAITLMDRADQFEMASVMRGYPNRQAASWKNCDGVSSANCQGVETIEFNSILQKCPTSTDLNCILEFGLIGADGAKIPASFDRKFPASALNAFSGNQNLSLPEGGPGSLWTFPTTAGMSQQTHFVRVSVQGEAAPGSKFSFTGFTAGVTPVVMTTRRCDAVQTWTLDNPCTPGDYPCIANCAAYGVPEGFSGSVENYGNADTSDCVMTGNVNKTAATVECANRKPSPTDVKYYLTVRLSQSPQGWLHGRLSEPDITISEITGGVELAIKGKPLRVPVVHTVMEYSALPAALKAKYARNGGWASTGGGSWNNWGLPDRDPADGTQRNRNSIPPSYGPEGIEELNAWMPTLNDTSTADRSTWSVRTLSKYEKGQANSCIADKTRVTGLVVTNATQYKAGAPELNKSTQALEYKVAAPHFMSSGEVFKGVYELIVRSDVARCIYGFTSAPIQATVDVVEENGATRTATTSVSESNGWLKLTAYGFTHSSPTIRATLTQAATASQPPATATPVTGITPMAKKVTMKAKSVLAANSVALKAGLKVARGAKVKVVVARSAQKVCAMSGARLRALKKGSCKVTVTVTSGKKKASKTLSITVT